jgi:carbon-monoxide dehydrogenase iron sulfur subunit
MPKMIVVNEGRCLGCRTCQLECALAHCEARTLVEAVRSGARPQARIHLEPMGEFALPLQCRHCEDAPCVMVCPTEAMHRPTETGPVLIDAEMCIGCKFCMLVCPFGVIDLSRDGKAMVKCDQCIERTEAGKEPACVAACPTGALEFREVEEWLRERRREAGAQLAAAQGIAGGKRQESGPSGRMEAASTSPPAARRDRKEPR